MKRITNVLLASALIVGVLTSLVACGNDSTSEAKETTSEATENTITADVSSSAADEITPEETEVKANTAEYFDPFDGIYIECSGADGDITVDVNFDNAYYDKSAYSITSKTEGLSDGDEITITVSDLALQQSEESDGLTPEQTTKTFYATAESKFITNANDIPDEFIEEYAEYCKNKIYEEYAEFDDCELLSAEYIGYKFEVNERPETEVNLNRKGAEYHNVLVFVYDSLCYDSIGIDGDTGQQVFEQEPTNCQITWNLADLTLDNNGTVSYGEEEISHNSDGWVVLADTVDN